MTNIEHLKTLTDNLPPIPKLSEMIHNPGSVRSYIEYDVEDGSAIGFGLLSQKEVGVQKLFISSGTTFPNHIHDKEVEFGILFEGKLEVEINGEKQIVEKGECVKFCCKDIHGARALEDTWLIAVSIPRIDGYPKA